MRGKAHLVLKGGQVMNTQSVLRATGIGAILQVAMVVAGHFLPALRDPGLAIGGMGISALAGWRAAGGGGSLGGMLVGGALAGGVCAALGIAVSVLFGDVPPSLLLLGTGSSIVTGVIGAAISRTVRRG
jgi:hypothetical protein